MPARPCLYHLEAVETSPFYFLGLKAGLCPPGPAYTVWKQSDNLYAALQNLKSSHARQAMPVPSRSSQNITTLLFRT